MNQLKLWCDFEVLHSYFRDGLCRDLDIIPDQNTEALLKQNGVHWHKSSTNTWALFGPTQLDLASFTAQSPDQQLVFNCQSSDPTFVQFTQYPIGELGHYEFSNKTLQQTGLAKTNLPSEFKSTTSASSPIIAKIDLDLSALTIGAQFQISFEARKTRWQYFIIPQQSIEDSLILQGQEAHLFTGPESKKMQNGTDAQCFDSTTNLLPIQEVSDVKLKLATQQTGNPGAAAKILIEHLPTPAPSSLTMPQDGGNDLMASVYIYV